MGMDLTNQSVENSNFKLRKEEFHQTGARRRFKENLLRYELTQKTSTRRKTEKYFEIFWLIILIMILTYRLMVQSLDGCLTDIWSGYLHKFSQTSNKA